MRVETAVPVGFSVSSLVVGSVAVPEATGASLTGVTVVPSVMAFPTLA